MAKSKKPEKLHTNAFGTVLSYVVLGLTALYWLLLFVGFVWNGAYTDFYWFFTFGQYGLTLLITALIMLTTIPIACRNVSRPLSAIVRIFAPFSAFCLYQALNSLAKLIQLSGTVYQIVSWVCFAAVIAIFVFTFLTIKKLHKLPAEKERELFEKRKKLFFTILAAEAVLSLAYICIICMILPREITLFLRYQ